MSNPFPESDLLTEDEAARALGISPHTLRDWRVKKTGPQYLKLGRKMVRYHPDALRRFAFGTLTPPSPTPNTETTDNA